MPDLHALVLKERQLFLRDTPLIGESLMEVTEAYLINYRILGNRDPVLYAHVAPRYEREEPELRKGPTAHYGRSKGPVFDPESDKPLMDRIREAIQTRLA